MTWLRKLMMQAQQEDVGASYIIENLAVYFDSRTAKDDKDSWCWIDSISGYKFVMDGVKKATDNGLIINHSLAGIFSALFDISKDTDTLEVCFVDETINGNRYGPFISDRHKNMGFYFINNGDIWGSAGPYHFPRYRRNIINGCYTISMCKDRCMQAGHLLKVNGSDYYNSSNAHLFKIGGGDFIGKIYAIRVYKNKLLTEEEMLANQQADNINYNLGLQLL